jgi:Family of unknown function (DUF6328)
MTTQAGNRHEQDQSPDVRGERPLEQQAQSPDVRDERPLEQQAQSPDGRDERPLERLDRNATELMTELRVAGTGIQVLLAFLLVVPFNNRFAKLSSFDRYVYFVTLLCIAIAAVLLIAPMVHHRLLFRQGQKRYLVDIGNRSAIIAAAFLAVGLTGILVLISNFIFGGLTPIIVGVAAALTVGYVWFALPLNRRRRR